MRYVIKRLNNREVELNDDLVSEYIKYDELRDGNFSIAVRSRYGHVPTEEEISKDELSRLCNEVLFSDLKAMALLPKALEIINNHREELKKNSDNGVCVEYPL